MKENDRLLKLLNMKKISQKEFAVLDAALKGQPSAASRYVSLFVNPFQKIAGIEAMGLGFFLLLGMSWLALQGQIHYPGLFDLQLNNIGTKREVGLSFGLLVYQNFVSILLLSGAYFIAAKIYNIRGLRWQDFLGTVMLSRYPYFMATLIFLFIVKGWDKPIDNGSPDLSFLGIVSVVAIIALVWQSLTYFFSYKESSGLSGKKLWVSFIVIMVVVEILSAGLTRIFF